MPVIPEYHAWSVSIMGEVRLQEPEAPCLRLSERPNGHRLICLPDLVSSVNLYVWPCVSGLKADDQTRDSARQNFLLTMGEEEARE